MPIEDNVLIFSLPLPAQSFQLLSELRKAPNVEAAAVVARSVDGLLHVEEQIEPRSAGASTVTGGAVGALLGVLGGPLGMLLGWSTGAMVGSTVDLDTALDGEDGLALLARGIAPGTNVVVAQISEPTPADENARAKKYGGTLTRIPVSLVLAEVDRAREVQRAVTSEARKQRRDQKLSDFKAKVGDFFKGDVA